MKVVQTKEQAVKHNTFQGKSVDMQLEMSSFAFEALSTGIYTHKIRAIIRELSTNAWDAHHMAGTADKRFDIQLPTSFDHSFVIRDYGTGLSEEEIFETYMCMFNSSKRDTNSQTGLFGLGSKTPYTYADQLTVTSYQNGVMSTYFSIKGDSGVPSMTKISEGPTSEPDGLKIQFAVDTKEDYARFISEARFVGAVFCDEPKPNFLNTSLSDGGWEDALAHLTPELAVFDDGKYHPSDFHLLHPLYVIQGNVAYPVEVNHIKNADARNTFDTLRSINKVYFIKVPIGTVMIPPSRESLDASEENYAKLTPFIKKIDDSLMDVFRELFKGITNGIEAAKYLAHHRYETNRTFFDAIMKERGIEGYERDSWESPDWKEEINDLSIELSNVSDYVKFVREAKQDGDYEKKIRFHCVNSLCSDGLDIVLVDEAGVWRKHIDAYYRGSRKKYIVLKDFYKHKRRGESFVKKELAPHFNVVRLSAMPKVKKPVTKRRKPSKFRWFARSCEPLTNDNIMTLKDLGIDGSKKFYYVTRTNGSVDDCEFGLSEAFLGTLKSLGVIDDTEFVSVASTRDLGRMLRAYPKAKNLVSIIKDGIPKKYSEKKMLEFAAHSDRLNTVFFRRFFEKLFGSIPENTWPQYRCGKEYKEFLTKRVDNPYNKLVQHVKVMSVFYKATDEPIASDGVLFKAWLGAVKKRPTLAFLREFDLNTTVDGLYADILSLMKK